MTLASVAQNERATTTNCSLFTSECSIDDSTESQTEAILFKNRRHLFLNQESMTIIAYVYQVYSIELSSQALTTLLTFFDQFKISKCLLERAWESLLTWDENEEVEEQQVNTIEVIQNKLMCDEVIRNLHQLKTIHLKQSTDKTRFISVNSQMITRIIHHQNHMRWKIEAMKIVLYAFSIDRRLQSLYFFFIATSILSLLKNVLSYLKKIVVEKTLSAAHVIEVCLSASYYSTLDWKNNVVATAESIGTRFSVSAQLRERVKLRKNILSRISSCKWRSKVRRLKVTRVDQRSNDYYEEFVLFNADVLFERQQLQAAFDELDEYTP